MSDTAQQEQADAQVPAAVAESQSQPPSVPGTPGSSLAQETPQKKGDALPEELQLAAPLAPCTTCGRPTNEQNSLVIVRSTSKQPDLRRCRACHATKAAIARLQNRAGNLVADFLAQDNKEATKQFFLDFGHLRGQKLCRHGGGSARMEA